MTHLISPLVLYEYLELPVITVPINSFFKIYQIFFEISTRSFVRQPVRISDLIEAVDLGVGGGIGEDPSFVEYIRQRIPADEAPGAIKNLVEAFAAHREPGQAFRQWVDATGAEVLIELSEPEETTYEDPCLTDAKQSWYPFANEDAEGARGAASADD